MLFCHYSLESDLSADGRGDFVIRKVRRILRNTAALLAVSTTMCDLGWHVWCPFAIKAIESLVRREELEYSNQRRTLKRKT